MKRIILLIVCVFVNNVVFANADVVKIEVPSTVEKVDIKYEKKSSSVLDKAVDGTKKITTKTIDATKSAVHKTEEGTKNLLDDISFPGEVTVASLEKKASIKILQNEKKALKAAYNSRIKDIKAKIKILEKSTNISGVQKRSKIYNYEKQIADLEKQRDSAMVKYDSDIKNLRENKK